MCSHKKKDIKHINRTIHSVACVMHKWCYLGMLVVKDLGVEICADAQSTAHSSNNNNNNNNNNSNYCQRKQSEISFYPYTYKLPMLGRGAVQLPQNT